MCCSLLPRPPFLIHLVDYLVIKEFDLYCVMVPGGGCSSQGCKQIPVALVRGSYFT